MIFVTAKKGKNHVTSQQFRGIVAAMAGTESYIADMDEHLEPELAVNNTIKIRSGTLIHHGGVMVVKSGTYDEVTYQNGTQAMKRIDLVVARYTQDTATKTENAEWVVIQGQPAESNPVAPDYIHGNMQDGDLADDCPIFELHFDGINVTEVRKLINIMQSVDKLNRNFKNLNYADGCIMINFGPIPNNGNKEIEMPLPAGVTDYWIESGWAYGSDKRRYPLPYVDVSTWGYSISCMISSPGRLQISTKSDWTGYSAKFLVAYKL